MYSGELILQQKQKLDTQLFRVRFVIEGAQEVNFQPGQFMSLLVNDWQRRSYSLANASHQNNYFETVANTDLGGPGSLFFERIKEGDRVQAILPLGHFVYDRTSAKPAYFFATGTGIVPLLSMIRSELLEFQTGRELNLIFGVRHERKFIAREELLQLAEQHPNFHYYQFVSQPELTETTGFILGRITDGIDNLLLNAQKDVDVYICGGTAMILDIEEKLLKLGVNSKNIKYERYY